MECGLRPILAGWEAVLLAVDDLVAPDEPLLFQILVEQKVEQPALERLRDRDAKWKT